VAVTVSGHIQGHIQIAFARFDFFPLLLALSVSVIFLLDGLPDLRSATSFKSSSLIK
jgi:hypothetical protein